MTMNTYEVIKTRRCTRWTVPQKIDKEKSA